MSSASRSKYLLALIVLVSVIGLGVGLLFFPADGEGSDPGASPGGSETIYAVGSNVSEGAVVVEFEEGGWVEQPFSSPVNRLFSLGAVTARDPSRGPAVPAENCSSGSIGQVLYEILDESGAVLVSQEMPACRDMVTRWRIEPPLLIDPQLTYTLRITNTGDTIISIYFNNSPDALPHGSLAGVVDSTGAEGKSVSGEIRAG